VLLAPLALGATGGELAEALFGTRPLSWIGMRIVDAVFPAADPEDLRAWYEDNVGAAPSFVRGAAAPHHFAFHTAALEPWRARLDVTEEHDFAAWDGARATYFRDPEDNVGELIARPEARPELAIAEVGLPVRDVAAAVAALAAVGIEPYRPWDGTFAPLGTADGLLIVVQVGRGWFPYDVPAGDGPIQVTVAGVRTGEVAVTGSDHRVVSI
jgi:hypothetical protein